MIDIGLDNEYVTEGDFHEIRFKASMFDGVYRNCLDHAWDLRKISIEAARVLKSSGILALDVPFAQPYKKCDYKKNVKKEHKYEATLCDSLADVINGFQGFNELYNRITVSIQLPIES